MEVQTVAAHLVQPDRLHLLYLEFSIELITKLIKVETSFNLS